ncbi:MAG: DNA replication/repair protein RecF [Acidimicrobiaceae bacterium]|nr:DNA replication/repair protein RecF [Acidimicrobiaceae bacterium]
MRFLSLALQDFRSYAHAEVEFAPGLTAIVGPNGHGKTNLLEALGLVAGLGSFRGAADAALIRDGAECAAVRCQGVAESARELRIELDLDRTRPKKIRVNAQTVPRRRDLLAAAPATVLSPEDLELVKGEPALRRRWLDDTLALVKPSWGALRSELDRILRQRNMLLRQAQGRAGGDITVTLDVWDEKLSAVGDRLRLRRRELLDALGPQISGLYSRLSAGSDTATARYASCWDDVPLADALAAARSEDLRRATTTVGPHRDDVLLEISGSPARSHASQGEKRSLALTMRLAADNEVRRRRGTDTVLLLDDVFSELDPVRSAALLEALPEGQRILTAPTPLLPEGVQPDQLLRVGDGAVTSVPAVGR